MHAAPRLSGVWAVSPCFEHPRHLCTRLTWYETFFSTGNMCFWVHFAVPGAIDVKILHQARPERPAAPRTALFARLEMRRAVQAPLPPSPSETSAHTRLVMAKAEFAAGTPAYTAVCNRTSRSTVVLSPARNAAAHVQLQLVVAPESDEDGDGYQPPGPAVQAGPAQTSPHGHRVRKSWNGAVSSVAPDTARST